MFKIFIFLLGFGISIVGLTYIISYMNLLVIGYNFLDYVKFISSRIECLLTILGFLLLFISIKGDKK